jgi:hypothetical protein
MRPSWRPGRSVVLALLLFAGGRAYAQPRLPHEAATLRPSAQALAGALQEAPATTRQGAARVDAAGVVRADYRLDAVPLPGLAPEAAARAYLTAHAARYGLAPDLPDLRLDTVIAGRYDAHVAFEQTVAGLPVYGAGVHVSLDAHGRVLLVTSTYAPEVRRQAVSAFGLDAAAAVARVRAEVVAVEADVAVTDLVAFRTAAGLRPAFVLTARPRTVPVEWRVVLDGVSGALLALHDRAIGHHDDVRRATDDWRRRGEAPAAGPPSAPLLWFVPDTTAGGFPTSASPLRGGAGDARRASPVARRTLIDGRGLVFDPDPLTTAGVPYGGAYADNGDADTPELNAQRREGTLPAITLRGGRYYLEGPYVEITGEPIQGVAATVPDEAAPTGFRYTRGDDRFESVMAYYHTDRSQRRVQALGVGRPIRERPIRINPRGLTLDDSRYLPSSNAIVFGTGGVDDAEDADVIWHEYAHALLDDQQPNLQLSTEGRALHEGWGDYWAASYSRRVHEAGFAHDWRRVYTWDGNNGCWQGRRLDHTGVYGATDRSRMAYPAASGCPALGTIYQWGLLWATTLMEIYDALGADVTDRLALASFAYLGRAAGSAPAAPPMEIAAEALIAADRALHAGRHEGVLVQRLAARGFVDASRYGPVLAHTPITSTEQSGGTRAVTVEAEGRTGAIQRVVVVYTVDGGAPRTLELAPEGGTRYGGALPVPAESATVRYYVEATDVQGRRTRLPAVEGEAYTFASGPDTTPPTVSHTPRVAIPVQTLPPFFEAMAADALGVASVEVHYALRRAGVERSAGTVALSLGPDGVWRGRPASFPAAAPGDTLVYRIAARDRAAAANERIAGPFVVPLTAGGMLALFNAETAEAGVTFGGAWQRGTPAYGLRTARAGRAVYSTALTGPYPDTPGVSTLELAPLDLRATDAYLTFWSWTDVERGGSCRSVCDGGRVEVSATNGVTWAPLEVEGGYRDTVDARAGSALAGQGVLEGDSHGWQRAVARLPQGPAVRVRFVFATDAGNRNTSTYGYAGWALDSIAVVTERPALGALPAGVTQASAPVAPGAAVPLRLRVPEGRDLVRVVARYELVRGGMVVRSDSVRLRQRPDSLTVFEATRRPDTRAGDTFRYRLVLTTAGGASTVLPESGSFGRAVRTLARTSVLAGAAPGGVWQATGMGYSAFPPSSTAAPVARPVSPLVLAPLDLPANADALRLAVRHRFRLGQTGETPVRVAGNVKLSDDDGRTWRVLPAAYALSTLPETHPLSGEPAFTGRSGTTGADTLTTVFDLSAYAGRQVRIRFDLGHDRPLELGEFWTLLDVALETATPDDAFETPRTLALSAPFPNPFRDRLAFAYTLPEAGPVEAVLYDVLGRRVAVLVAIAMQDPGTYPVLFDADALAPGTYVLRVRAGADTLTRTVTKGR